MDTTSVYGTDNGGSNPSRPARLSLLLGDLVYPWDIVSSYHNRLRQFAGSIPESKALEGLACWCASLFAKQVPVKGSVSSILPPSA
jgi:hypothetical protein